MITKFVRGVDILKVTGHLETDISAYKEDYTLYNDFDTSFKEISAYKAIYT